MHTCSQKNIEENSRPIELEPRLHCSPVPTRRSNRDDACCNAAHIHDTDVSVPVGGPSTASISEVTGPQLATPCSGNSSFAPGERLAFRRTGSDQTAKYCSRLGTRQT